MYVTGMTNAKNFTVQSATAANVTTDPDSDTLTIEFQTDGPTRIITMTAAQADALAQVMRSVVVVTAEEAF